MQFPFVRNGVKSGEFRVIATLPMTTVMFSTSTKIEVRQGNEVSQMGIGVHHPIFHPTVQNPPEAATVGLETVSQLIDHISQKFLSYRNSKRPTHGKCSVVLYGPYQNKEIARGVAHTMNMRFEYTDASKLIKDYPDDSVAAVDELFTGRGPCVLFIDRFDNVAPEVGRGYSYITDVIAAKLKLTLDEPLENLVFIIAGARWRSFVEPGIHSRVSDVLFCGPQEEQQEWDSVGTCLRRLMTLPYKGEHSRWRTPSVVLYGWNSSQMWNVASSFAACRSLKLVRAEASHLLRLYNRVGHAAVADLFLRATCERPALLFIDSFDTVGDHAMINELCVHLDNMDRQVHVFVAVRWWQLMNPQLLEAGRLDKQVFCGTATTKVLWDYVGNQLLRHQQSRGP
ncbi:unnamed protein product [Triticum turgidum subsp. durum]|uniref:ATPase AAA-type core domain-containing protein n=1 Tax=Triticum turgidum subsp. durum TaxID=4567 RepID=A0A9R0XDL8_TRITD|nr:unnamed protein product [Triticum turgidum subsp. durum]